MMGKYDMLSEKDRMKYEIAEELGLLDKVKNINISLLEERFLKRILLQD